MKSLKAKSFYIFSVIPDFQNLPKYNQFTKTHKQAQKKTLKTGHLNMTDRDIKTATCLMKNGSIVESSYTVDSRYLELG